jgi:phosphatidylserine/phosphatidylglycerophosphate/cardiolipin synthase-like enzyme
MVKKLLLIFLILFISGDLHAVDCPMTPSILSYYFSPKGKVAETIVSEINNAKKEILVQAYVFTSLPIADALIDAKNRGVSITIVADGSAVNANGSKINLLFDALIPVFLDKVHSIAHNKVIIIDKKILITGSFNYTASAENTNAENIIIIKRNYCIVNGYIKNFEDHKSHSQLYNKIIVGSIN